MKLTRSQIGPGLVVACAIAVLAWSGPDRATSSAAGKSSRPEAVEKDEPGSRKPSPEARLLATEHVLAKLAGGNASDRAKAVAILRNMGESALTMLRDQFAREDGGKRREAAAFALAVLGNDADKEGVAAAFVSAGKSASGLLVSAAAELKDPGLATHFLGLRSSKNATVRAAVARAMRADEFPSIEQLMPLLADPEPRVRAVAEHTLNGMLARTPDAEIRMAAKEALRSSDRGMRLTALRLCERVDAAWAVDLAAKAATDKDALVRAQAVKTLAASGDARAAAPLTTMLRAGSGRIERVRAANALGKVDAPPASIEALAKAAASKDPMVALAAGRALVSHRDARGIAALVGLRNIKKSSAMDVDDEDSMLLAKLSRNVLKQVEGKTKRRAGENWDQWWSRVRKDYRFPTRKRIPELPANH